MRSILLLLLGVPLPIIILTALFVRQAEHVRPKEKSESGARGRQMTVTVM